MYCQNCGTVLNEGAAFCANCGAPVAAPVAPAENPETAGMRKPILVNGILGVAFASPFLLTWVVGLIFSIITKCKVKKFLAAGGQLTGRAKAGNILATIGLILNGIIPAYVVTAATAYGIYSLVTYIISLVS